MAVPAHDSRDFAFARHFDLPIIQVVSQPGEVLTDVKDWEESNDGKEGILINSDFINSMHVKEAISSVLEVASQRKFGRSRTNYRLRDAIF